jgi:hypothetical protein
MFLFLGSLQPVSRDGVIRRVMIETGARSSGVARRSPDDPTQVFIKSPNSYVVPWIEFLLSIAIDVVLVNFSLFLRSLFARSVVSLPCCTFDKEDGQCSRLHVRCTPCRVAFAAGGGMHMTSR